MKQRPVVSLIMHTPEPERVCATAARLCYSDCSIQEVSERIEKSDVEKFLSKIMSIGHYSVLEHASFTFGVENVSRALTHQLVRHRIASFSQQSQRYVKATETFTHLIPETVKNCKKLTSDGKTALQVFQETIQQCGRAYAQLSELGIPAEDARYLLPNATETKIILTMNVRELLHFFEKRCCERAQWEIRDMAEQMLALAKEVSPVLFGNAGPPCITKACPEGVMSCGKPRKKK